MTKPADAPPITRLALYVRDMPKVADFYSRHFGFIQDLSEMPGLLRLTPPSGGCALALLQTSKGHKVGQSCIKLVFDVADIAAFRERSAARGLKFGAIHRCDGYAYANARDPAKNLIQISSRAFKA